MTQIERHALLLSAVAPRPISFVSTIDRSGNVNLSPFSFFNVFSSNPPVLIFSPSRKGRDGSTKHSHDNVLEVPECVINIVNYPMVEQMSLASTEYEKGVNEFVKAGFTEVKSDKVRPPRVGESPVSMECKVLEVLPMGQSGGSGNLVICEVVLIHVLQDYMNEQGQLDTTKLQLVGRMGEIWYTKAFGDALFEIPKPSHPVGVGVDALPAHVWTSSILTGNDLGRMGNVPSLPAADDIESYRTKCSAEGLDIFYNLLENHRVAKGWLDAGKIKEAIITLILYEQSNQES